MGSKKTDDNKEMRDSKTLGDGKNKKIVVTKLTRANK
jgi:hypothetical protein